MGADRFDVDRTSDHRCQRLVLDLAVRKVELCIAQIADARCEAETDQMHLGEDMICEAGSVGIYSAAGDEHQVATRDLQ